MSAPTQEPIDTRIVQEIARVLGLIAPARGYYTSGLVVLTEELPAGEAVDRTVPVVEVLDEHEVLIKQSAQYREGKLTVSLDFTVPRFAPAGQDGNVPPSTARRDLRRLLWDARRAFTTEPLQFGAGITTVEIGNRQIPPAVEGSQFLDARVDLVVTFTEKYTASE